MKDTVSKQKVSKVKILFWVLICVCLLFGGLEFSFGATKTNLVSGLSAPVGAALDEENNFLYFVESGTGTLKRLDISPGASGLPETISTGFLNPEDVELDVASGFAYVITSDFAGYPANYGAFWKVEISTGAKTLLTYNLKAPKQLALDLLNNEGYVTCYDDGKLRRIDLITGIKVPVCTTLDQPVGVVITNDAKYAYVSEQGTVMGISKIDLTLGTMIGTPGDVASGLTAPFFLAWTDVGENSLYVVEQAPDNRVSRVDLVTSDKYEALTGFTEIPSGAAVNRSGFYVYVTTATNIDMYQMVELAGPIFMGVGHVPATNIDNGYATTASDYFFRVTHAPFGGTLNIFANLTDFYNVGATHYAVIVQKDSDAPQPLGVSWKMYKWNTVEREYELVTIAPDTGAVVADGNPVYEIPLDGGVYEPAYWYPPFLFMRWPSGENGLYTFTVILYNSLGNPIALPPHSPEEETLVIRVDKTAPIAEIKEIWQEGTPDEKIATCEIVNTGNPNYYFKITAYDPNHHLLSYRLSALWGNNQSDHNIDSESYDGTAVPPDYHWGGIVNQYVKKTSPWVAQCDCAHTFYLRVWKRTINGYNHILYRDYHKSITIDNTPAGTCSD